MADGETSTAASMGIDPNAETGHNEAMSYAIVHSDDPDDVSQPETDVAPDSGHQTESEETSDAPENGTPTDEAGATGEANTETTEGDEAGTAAADEAAQAEAAEKAEQTELDELLGLAETGSKPQPTWDASSLRPETVTRLLQRPTPRTLT